MNATTKSAHTQSSAVMLAIDLAKDVFELAFADADGRIVERKRPKRGPFHVDVLKRGASGVRSPLD